MEVTLAQVSGWVVRYLLTIQITDILDIAIMAFVLYKIFTLVQSTKAASLVKGLLIFLAALVLSSALHLNGINYIMSRMVNLGLLALIILFQPEIRRALERMGQTDQWAAKLFNVKGRYNDPSFKGAWRSAIIAICDAAERFSETKTGALIVFERRERLGEIISTGTMVDAAPSAELIKNIFFKNSPLHDGAMIVRAGRVCAAGCVLPLSGNQSLSRDLGTRHRAAVGMSESADSVLVVVSEETGSISVAIGGMLKRHLSPDMLRKLLENELLDSEKQEKSRLAAIRDIWKGGAGK